MNELGGGLIENTQNLSPNSEKLQNQHFQYTLVFGQGPVQEKEKIPTTGREGLNFYSRLTAFAAAQMLKKGITEKVILSGGKTGARAETQPEQARTEAELMADIIRRKLTNASDDGKTWEANGKKIARFDQDGKERPQEEIQRELEDAYRDIILIENQAKDTLENFAFILGKYIDVPGQNPDEVNIALLGIGFHAKDTFSGAGVGRLDLLADIFQLKATVFSAEDVTRELVVSEKSPESYVGKSLKELTRQAETHTVSILKSQQERLLVESLRSGAWVGILRFLRSPDRVKSMVLRNPYVSSKLCKQLGLSTEQIAQAPFDEILDYMNSLRVSGTNETAYRAVKQAVFNSLQAMSEREGIDYFGKYAKGIISPSPLNNQ